MYTEHVHKPDRPPGAFEGAQTQAVRAAGQHGGLLGWERAYIASEYAKNMWALKKAQEFERRKKGEHSYA